MEKEIEFYTAWICPYAHRVKLALEYKKANYKPIEIDLTNKSESFLKVNPRGLVPALRVSSKIDNETKYFNVIESIICLEYLDEIYPESAKLYPENLEIKALCRINIDYIGSKIIPIFYKILKTSDKVELEELKSTVIKNLKEFSKEMEEISPNTKFFFKDEPGALDIAFVTFVYRFEVAKFYRDFELPKDDPDLKRFYTWWENMQEWTIFKENKPEISKLIDAYVRIVTN